MRVLLLHNPGAGDRNLPGPALAEIFEAAGHAVTYRDLKQREADPRDAEAAEVIVAAGGDGTVGEAVRALRDCERPFAIVPLGTANNVARCLGATADAAALARGLAGARERRLDLGTAEGPA